MKARPREQTLRKAILLVHLKQGVRHRAPEHAEIAYICKELRVGNPVEYAVERLFAGTEKRRLLALLGRSGDAIDVGVFLKDAVHFQSNRRLLL